MNEQYPNVNTLWAAILVDEFARAGVRHAVLSPGSRSTPLVLSFAAHADITVHTFIDERSAAFFALGLAREQGSPVCLLSTSGTAAANFYPAVCEADASGVPLLLLTADRPVHLRDAAAAQTMDQVHLFGGHVRWFHDVAQAEAEETKLRYLRSTACYAVALTQEPRPGPVHLNLPLRKPLEPIESERPSHQIPKTLFEQQSPGAAGRRDGTPYTQYLPLKGSEGRHLFERILDRFLNSRRIIVVAGPDTVGGDMREALSVFTGTTGMPVFAEACSQQRFQSDRDRRILAEADLLFRSMEFRRGFMPDLIIRLGAPPTSVALTRFLELHSDVPQLLLAPDIMRRDPTFTALMHVAADPAALLIRLAAECSRLAAPFDTDWADSIVALAEQARAFALARLQRTELFEGTVFSTLPSCVPCGGALFIASSMPVRDLEAFGIGTTNSIDLFFNRGVNGIDGTMSTALGVARSRRSPALLFTGDIAFLHDLNAMLYEERKKVNLTVVLLNNDGGHIFDMLPVRNFDPAFTRHFVTPHGADMGALAQAFGVRYQKVTSIRECEQAACAALGEAGVDIIELPLQRERSAMLRRAVLLETGDALDADVTAVLSPPSKTRHSLPLSWRRLCRTEEGEAVVFLHGFTRSAHSWNALVSRLPSRPMLAVDLPGHGDSPVSDDASYYGLGHTAALLAELLDRLQLGRVHLVGYSLGARAAAVFATTHPERLASLALLSGTPGIADEHERSARKRDDAMLATTIEEGGLEAFVENWMQSPLFARMEATRVEEVRLARRERMAQKAHGLAMSLRYAGQGSMQPVWDALGQVRCPVLLCTGEKDSKYVTIAERMLGLLPDARHVSIPDASHDVVLEGRDLLQRMLPEFWAEAEAAGGTE